MTITAKPLDVGLLGKRKALERLEVTLSADGLIGAIKWRYDSVDNGLYNVAKRLGGKWHPELGGWTFDSPEAAQTLVDKAIKRNPDWPVIGLPGKEFLPLRGISFFKMTVRKDLDCDACIIQLPVSDYAQVGAVKQAFELVNTESGEKVAFLIGNSAQIAAVVESMIEQGATPDKKFSRKWPMHAANAVGLRVDGWALTLACDTLNPVHYLIAPIASNYRQKNESRYEHIIRMTRSTWPRWKKRLDELGIEIFGDNPEADFIAPANFDETLVSGWSTPAPNGHLLHAYQKDGARFCASRGMRALIGDEMGVGKTIQAIAAAEATAAKRIIIICPSNARYVWDREIREWGGRGAIQHLESQLATLDVAARWHILTYDLLTPRTEIWKLGDKQEKDALLEVLPEFAPTINDNENSKFPLKISIKKPFDVVPEFSEKRKAAWRRAMQRLNAELVGQVISALPASIVLDEAHRLKNRDAKRTEAIRRITACDQAEVLMLTGTPLRNNQHEAASLLSMLDAEASIFFSSTNGYTINDIKDFLAFFMIRRTKADVMPELPPKTRQRIDISSLEKNHLKEYEGALIYAQEIFDKAIAEGASKAVAYQKMSGGIEMARSALGLAKVLGGQVSELVLEVVENKGCCVVFCAHHDVSDSLKALLQLEKLCVEIIDGRVPAKQRALIVDQFQAGKLDVVIGSINAAGEAITLTRADTIIFVELDWVPGALQQAEDRIHRKGQINSCHIIQLVARIDGKNLDEIMVDLIGRKLATIGDVLGEDGSNIIGESIKPDFFKKLLRVRISVNVTERFANT